MPYTVEPVYCDGKIIPGQWRLVGPNGSLPPIFGHDQFRMEEIAGALNILTDAQRREVKDAVYRKLIHGEAA